MKIPKKVKVNGLTFTVSIEGDLDNAGETNVISQTIKIQKSHLEAMEATFCHELFHAINKQYSEQETEFFGRALYQLVKDNKEMFK